MTGKYLVVRLEDGTLCDLFSPIAHSQTVTLLTFDDPDGRVGSSSIRPAT